MIKQDQDCLKLCFAYTCAFILSSVESASADCLAAAAAESADVKSPLMMNCSADSACSADCDICLNRCLLPPTPVAIASADRIYVMIERSVRIFVRARASPDGP